MANKLYDKGRALFGEGGIAWSSDTIKVALVSSASYTPNYSTDQYHNVIAGGAIIAAGVALTSKTNAAGTLGAANAVWTSVSGSQAAFIEIYKDTGTSSTSPLIGLIDTATGLPVTPNGGDITAAWSGGNIFTLFEGLDEKDKVQHRWLWEWLRDVCRIPAVLGPGGRVWIPQPQILVTA